MGRGVSQRGTWRILWSKCSPDTSWDVESPRLHRVLAISICLEPLRHRCISIRSSGSKPQSQRLTDGQFQQCMASHVHQVLNPATFPFCPTIREKRLQLLCHRTSAPWSEGRGLTYNHLRWNRRLNQSSMHRLDQLCNTHVECQACAWLKLTSNIVRHPPPRLASSQCTGKLHYPCSLWNVQELCSNLQIPHQHGSGAFVFVVHVHGRGSN